MRTTTEARPTAKEREAKAEAVRAQARSLAFCNELEFWSNCPAGRCRRNHSCRGDAHACFMRHWRGVPEDVLAAARDRINAREQASPASS